MVAARRVLFWPGLHAAVFHVAGAVPVDYFPINSQLPPVARISEPFSFTFSPLTFASDLPMSYSLRNAPEWLSIDSDARRLFGTPGDADVPPGDVVGVHVELVAQDTTGSAIANSTLVVSRNPAPSVEIPLDEQIAKIGPYSAPSSLLLYPSRPFSFSFAEQTFRAGGGLALNYYAVSGDSAPLPSWVSFDADNLTFSGTTPPFESLVQPPQAFGFQLVASDVLGFASASIPFSIVVGNHELTADEAVVELNASHGKAFEYAGLPGMLKIDGRPLKIEEVTSVAASDLPRWLDFDAETWRLSGTPDAAAESSNGTISVVDRYTDTLNVTIVINMEMELFVSSVPDMNITAGEDLSLDLKRYLLDPQKVDISIDSQPPSPWIHLDPVSKRLSGTAPEAHTATYAPEITLTFKATMKRGGATDTTTMVLHVVDPAPTEPTPAPTIIPAPKEAESDTSRRKLLWLLLPLLLLVSGALILLLFRLRRRRQGIGKVHVMEVSAPIPGTFVNYGSGSGDSSLHDIRKMLDIGPPPGTDTGVTGPTYGATTHAVAGTSSSIRVVSDPSTRTSLQPHAITLYNDKRKSRSDTALIEARTSWFARPPRRIGHNEATDERSLLSDTSLGEGDIHIAEESRLPGLARTTNDNPYGSNRFLLDVPLISEPFSIQPTPEIAYQPFGGAAKAGKYDLSSSSLSEDGFGSSSTLSSEPTPVVGYTTRHQNHYHRPRSGLGLGVGGRLSRVLKRVSGQQGGGSSGDDHRYRRNRSSNLSSSTSQTTRTSILTTMLAEQQHASTATASTSAGAAVAKPTIVHIASRPGEARQLSRRAGGDSSAVFFSGGGSRSPRNFISSSSSRISEGSYSSPSSRDGGGVPHPSTPPRVFVAASASRDSDISWDRLARNSLGIAYKDLVTPPEQQTRRQSRYIIETDARAREPPNWRKTTQEHPPPPDQSQSSPASTASGEIGARSSWIKPLRIPKAGATPEGKGKQTAPTTSTSTTTALQTPISSLSRPPAFHRRQAPISHTTTTPSPPPLVPLPPAPPNNERATAGAEAGVAVARPLPETPTPAGRRRPLADRLNESTPPPPSLPLPLPANRGVGSVRKRSGGGNGNGNGGGDDDDGGSDGDIWEDLRPPESTFGGGGDWGEDGEGTDGSFVVYI